jgi:predicted metal-dependent hydrolase
MFRAIMAAHPAPLSDTSRLALAEGCRLFDAGSFFEAHEVWEAGWRLESGEARELLHGLIQIAAGFHKGLVQGNPSGMARLLRRGLERIAYVRDFNLLDLSGFAVEVTRWAEAASRWAKDGERPSLPLPHLAGG